MLAALSCCGIAEGSVRDAQQQAVWEMEQNNRNFGGQDISAFNDAKRSMKQNEQANQKDIAARRDSMESQYNAVAGAKQPKASSSLKGPQAKTLPSDDSGRPAIKATLDGGGLDADSPSADAQDTSAVDKDITDEESARQSEPILSPSKAAAKIRTLIVVSLVILGIMAALFYISRKKHSPED